MGKYVADVEPTATDLEQCDVLGKPWLTRVNPQINWRRNVLQIWQDDKPIRVEGTGARGKRSGGNSRQQQHGTPEVKMISPARFKRMMRKKGNLVAAAAVSVATTAGSAQEAAARGTSPKEKLSTEELQQI